MHLYSFFSVIDLQGVYILKGGKSQKRATMEMRSRWCPLWLLFLLAIASVCAALVSVSALHESLFASPAGSEYASALRDDTIDLDDDDDSEDMPTFALEAAQEDAARLLDSFDASDFPADDEDDFGDEGGDMEIAGAAVEEEKSDEEEHEKPATDVSVRPVSIEFHRSDATVQDEDEMDDRIVYEEADELTESESEDAAEDMEEIMELVEQSETVADEELGDVDLGRPEEDEREKEEENAEYELNGISKRVEAVFLKVRGVIFPNGDTKKTEGAANLGDVAPESVQTPSFETELLSDVYGDLQIDASSSSYRKSTAVVEQVSSFFEASTESTDIKQDDPSLSIDLELSDYVALEVEVHSEPVKVTVSSSEREDTVTRVAADKTEDTASEAEETIAVAVVNTVSSTDPASDRNLYQSQSSKHLPVDLNNNDSSTSMDTAYESIGSAVTSFQEIVLEMATAAEQMVMALRHGHHPQLPVIIPEARAKMGAGVKVVMDPAVDTVILLQEYFAVAQTELSTGLEIALVRLNNLWEYLKLSLSNWSQHLSSAYRQVSQWCWEMWSTYKEVRILGRNLYGFLLLVPCGLVFLSLYRVVAAIPEFLCTYFLTFDEVTKAQLKIFSAVLLLVLVYHARVLAWFWLLLSATLGYYYWSGHVVISVKFK